MGGGVTDIPHTHLLNIVHNTYLVHSFFYISLLTGSSHVRSNYYTFPHRALDSQKQWMKKYMEKPQDMLIRSTSATLNRLDICLSFFPGGLEASKLTKTELVEILEFSLPLEWRQKFDLDGYILTNGTFTQLIQKGEATE